VDLILLVIALSATVLTIVFTSVYFLNRTAERAARRNAINSAEAAGGAGDRLA
jgi:hypothetical protein